MVSDPRRSCGAEDLAKPKRSCGAELLLRVLKMPPRRLGPRAIDDLCEMLWKEGSKKRLGQISDMRWP